MSDTFKLTLPAEVSKSETGEWRIHGLASTQKVDKQGEIIVQNGIDLTPIDQGKGYFNFDHNAGIENLVGVIDGYKRDTSGLYVKGRLFQNHDKAKAIYQVMSSLGKSDRGRVGLSVEGKILKRNQQNPKIIEKCEISKVAITLNPVNVETYADLAKSLNCDNLIKSLTEADLDFSNKGEITLEHAQDVDTTQEKLFSVQDVVLLLTKALAVGSGYADKTPAQLSGGEALAQESLDKKPKNTQKPKEDKEKTATPKASPGLKGMLKSEYQTSIYDLLNKIQDLYPNYSRSDLWSAVKDRLNQRFPDLKN